MKNQKHHPTWSNLARTGLDKYTTLSTKAMSAYKNKYSEAGHKYKDSKKQHFYEFVARARLRSKK